ncbi:molecular chaperone [Klebsiella aerogenes]|nr:molecular chaperone [Klebsiella aerogenes]
MKCRLMGVAVVLMAAASVAQAGVVIGATRLIYDGGKKESSLNVNNPDKVPYLIQSWVSTQDSGTEKAPFVITPPLFRLNGGEGNILRVVRAGGNLPEDRESLYWMNIKSIPTASTDEQKSQLQIAVNSRMKLIYRPKGLKGAPDERAGELKWQRTGDQLQVTNPTPFYMNFYSITVGGNTLKKVTFVPPMGHTSFPLPKGAGNGIHWKVINDYGGIGEDHAASL